MKAFNALFILSISFFVSKNINVASAAPIPSVRSLEAKDLDQHVKEYKAVSGLGADIFERKTSQRRAERVTSFARDDSPGIDSSTSEVADLIKDLIATSRPDPGTLVSALVDIIGNEIDTDNPLHFIPDVGEVTPGTNVGAPNNLAGLLPISENDLGDDLDLGIDEVDGVDEQGEAGEMGPHIDLLDEDIDNNNDD